MKKLLAVVLVLAMTLCFAACGNDKPSSSAADNSGSADVAGQSSAVAPTSIARGTWDGFVFSNPDSNIKLTIPETWTISTDEQIAQIMGVSMDLLGKDKEAQVELAKQRNITDIMVSDPATGNNININYENMAMIENGKTISMDAYVEMVKQQLKGVEGITYTMGETSTKTVGAETYTVLPASVEYSGTSFNQFLLMRRAGDYMISIAITSMDSAEGDAFYKMFS